MPPLDGYVRIFRFYVSHALIIKILVLIAVAIILYLTVLQPLVFADYAPEEQNPTDPTTETDPKSETDEEEKDEQENLDDADDPENPEDPDDTGDADDPQGADDPKEESDDPSTELQKILGTYDDYYDITVNIYGDVEVNIDSISP